MEQLIKVYDKMLAVRQMIDASKDFRFSADIDSKGVINVYLWTKDYKDTITTDHFSVDNGAVDAIAFISRIEGYVMGYKLGYETAKNVEAEAVNEVEM